MLVKGLINDVLNELVQAEKTESAIEQYQESVKKDAPTDIQKEMHDTMVWEETKSYMLACATTASSNQAPPEEKQAKP